MNIFVGRTVTDYDEDLESNSSTFPPTTILAVDAREFKVLQLFNTKHQLYDFSLDKSDYHVATVEVWFCNINIVYSKYFYVIQCQV